VPHLSRFSKGGIPRSVAFALGFGFGFGFDLDLDRFGDTISPLN
jgi:hypothetical protein